jgi:hypothetical protein
MPRIGERQGHDGDKEQDGKRTAKIKSTKQKFLNNIGSGKRFHRLVRRLA